jgi:ketosteroid isomerase-like protein
MDGHGTTRDQDEEIGATRAAFVAALRGGDAVAAAAVYSENASLLPPSAEPLKGRDAITAFWRAGVDAGISDVELDALELERVDGLAYEVGRYALRLQQVGGETVVDRGSYVLVHVREADGSWRRAVEMFSPAASPATAHRAVD